MTNYTQYLYTNPARTQEISSILIYPVVLKPEIKLFLLECEMISIYRFSDLIKSLNEGNKLYINRSICSNIEYISSIFKGRIFVNTHQFSTSTGDSIPNNTYPNFFHLGGIVKFLFKSIVTICLKINVSPRA